MERVVNFLGLLPMKKPTVYTGIRVHALKAWRSFNSANDMAENTVIGRLNKYRADAGLEDLDIASECAGKYYPSVFSPLTYCLQANARSFTCWDRHYSGHSFILDMVSILAKASSISNEASR